MKPQSLSKLYTLLESVNIRNQQLVNSLSNPRSRETSPQRAPLCELYTLQQQNNQLIEDVNYLKVKYKELSLGTDELILRGQTQKKHIKELLISLKMKDDQLRRMRIRFNITDVSDDIRLSERSVIDYAIFLEEQIQQLDNKNKPSQVDELLKKKSEELQKSLNAQEKVKAELSQLKKQYQKDMHEINQDMCELQESIKANEVIKQQEIEQRNRVIDQQAQQLVKQSDCFNQLIDVKQINDYLQSNLKELETQNQELEAAFNEINKLNVEQHHYIAQVCKELSQVKQQLNRNEDKYKELLEEKQEEIQQIKHQKTSSASKAETTKFLEKSNALQTKLESQEVQITQLKHNTKLKLVGILKQLAQFRTYIKQFQHDTLDDQQIYHQFVQQLISEQRMPQGKGSNQNSYAALMKCVGILNQLQVDRGQCNDLKTEVEQQLQDRNTICEQQMLKLTRYCESQMITFKEDTKKQMDLLIFDLNEQHDIIYKQERQLKLLESQLQDESTSYNQLLDKYNRLVVSSNELTLPLESGYDLTIQQLENDNQQYQFKFQSMSKELYKLEQTKQLQEQQLIELTRNFKDLQICAQLGLSNVNEHKTAMEQQLQQKEEAFLFLQQQSKLQIEELNKQLQAKDIEMAESLVQMRQSQLSQLEECMSNQMDSPLKQASPQLTMQFKDWEQSKQLTQSQETMEELEKSTQQVGTLQQQVTNLNQQVHNLTSELSQKQHQYDKMQVFWKQSVAQKQKRKQQLFKELLGALSATKASFMVHKNQITMELEKYRGYNTQTIQSVFGQVDQLTDVRENLIELAHEQSDFKQFLSNQHPMQIAQEAVLACKEYFSKIILELQQQLIQAEQQLQQERQLNLTESKNQEQQNIDKTMKLSYEIQQSELKCENLEQQLNELEKMLKAQQDQNNQLKQDNKQMANGLNVADVYSKLKKKEQEHQNEIQLNKQFEEKIEQKDDEIIELKQVISNLQKQQNELQITGLSQSKVAVTDNDKLRSNIVSALLEYLEAYSTNDYEMNDYKDELYRLLDLSKTDKDKLNSRFEQLKNRS